MTQPSTISIERLTDQIHKITLSNPPANLIVPETVSGLHEAVKEMSEDTQVKVAIFASSTPDYFFNHFDLSQASDFPATPNAHSTPAWVELVVRLKVLVLRGVRDRGGPHQPYEPAGMSTSNEVRGASGRASRAARSIAAIWSTSSDRDATAAVSGSGTVLEPAVVVTPIRS